jgi:hypothetical protein
MPATRWPPGFATTDEASESGAEINEALYHQVVTFRAGRMVRIEYFGEWSEALKAAGLSDG